MSNEIGIRQQPIWVVVHDKNHGFVTCQIRGYSRTLTELIASSNMGCYTLEDRVFSIPSLISCSTRQIVRNAFLCKILKGEISNEIGIKYTKKHFDARSMRYIEQLFRYKTGQIHPLLKVLPITVKRIHIHMYKLSRLQ